MNIMIIIFVLYFGYKGSKKGFIRELSQMISYIFGFLLARIMFSIFSNNIDMLITNERLRDKLSYLIAFIIIVYIFKILTGFIENLIHLKLKNKLFGLMLGLINGIIIFALIISITKEILPPTFNLHQHWKNNSFLYNNLNLLQEKYLIQYKQTTN